MKQMWLIYLDDEYQGMQWEASEEEALAAYRSCKFPPEDEDGESLYPGDKPMKVTARPLQEGEGIPKSKRERQFEELRAFVSQMPFSIVHTGTRRDEHGFVDAFVIDIESHPLQGVYHGTEIVKGRTASVELNYATLEARELAFVYGPHADRQREKALRYLRHYGTFPILPDPILSYEQARELHDKFRESFEAFKNLSDAFKRFSSTRQLADRWEGPRRTAIRIINDTLQTMAAEQQRNAPRGPQPRKKWRQAWKTPHPARR